MSSSFPSPHETLMTQCFIFCHNWCALDLMFIFLPMFSLLFILSNFYWSIIRMTSSFCYWAHQLSFFKLLYNNNLKVGSIIYTWFFIIFLCICWNFLFFMYIKCVHNSLSHVFIMAALKLCEVVRYPHHLIVGLMIIFFPSVWDPLVYQYNEWLLIVIQTSWAMYCNTLNLI